MSRIFTISLAATLAVAATTALAVVADPAPPAAEITSASYAGSGCKTVDKAHAHLGDGRTTLVVEVPEQLTEIAGRGGGTYARVNCDAIVTIKHTPGWQVTPAVANVGLIAHLADGANGDLTYKAYQQGSPDTASAHVPLNPGDTPGHDEKLKLTEVWSACGDTATIIQGTALKIRGGDGPSKLAGRPETLELKWRTCK